MTLAEIGELTAAVMRATGVARSEALEAFCASHPHILPSEVYGTAAGLGRCSFPSIDGSPPVFKDRPYYSATAEERAQFNDAIIERDDLI